MISKLPIFFSIVTFSFCLFSCSDTDSGDNETDCGDKVVINEDLYQNGDADFINIISVELMEDCLTIQYAASGCSGDSWELALYDSGAIAESLPEQRFIRLALNNPEACLAVFEREISFDISDLRISGSAELILNLDNYESVLNYRY